MKDIKVPATLPCIKDKCILLPICKTKKFIECNKLKQYMDDHFKDTVIVDERTRGVYKYLLSIFKNVQGIYKDKNKVESLPGPWHVIPKRVTMYSTPNHPMNKPRN